MTVVHRKRQPGCANRVLCTDDVSDLLGIQAKALKALHVRSHRSIVPLPQRGVQAGRAAGVPGGGDLRALLGIQATGLQAAHEPSYLSGAAALECIEQR